jgi:hypothetical protein
MSTNEVDLNDPLNWYIADSMDDYDVRLDSKTAKRLMHRHNGYPKLVEALRDAIATLEMQGCHEKAEVLRRELEELGEIWFPVSHHFCTPVDFRLSPGAKMVRDAFMIYGAPGFAAGSIWSADL